MPILSGLRPRSTFPRPCPTSPPSFGLTLLGAMSNILWPLSPPPVRTGLFRRGYSHYGCMFFVLQLSTLPELSQCPPLPPQLFSLLGLSWPGLALVHGERSSKWIHNRVLGLCARACSDRLLALLVSRVTSSTIAERLLFLLLLLPYFLSPLPPSRFFLAWTGAGAGVVSRCSFPALEHLFSRHLSLLLPHISSHHFFARGNDAPIAWKPLSDEVGLQR
ncbi:hypothetical protein B0J13DRAFT_304487 [Dactylonectria estremocensis]|uniref:Uncharacterized protein n=1 Tax=Dactylonectria estremocensis TaxID=1079267 RepID=A0A9P9F1D9_9HYPO|nr:hypothetical protein B0J13DRAFT_304487 [Dactylonectria estremocensis]